jgi:hypothetical protein
MCVRQEGESDRISNPTTAAPKRIPYGIADDVTLKKLMRIYKGWELVHAAEVQ